MSGPAWDDIWDDIWEAAGIQGAKPACTARQRGWSPSATVAVGPVDVADVVEQFGSLGSGDLVSEAAQVVGDLWILSSVGPGVGETDQVGAEMLLQPVPDAQARPRSARRSAGREQSRG